MKEPKEVLTTNERVRSIKLMMLSMICSAISLFFTVLDFIELLLVEERTYQLVAILGFLFAIICGGVATIALAYGISEKTR